MIKSLTARTLHELIQSMHKAGLSLNDTEGTVHTNESGHYFILFQSSETDVGVIDTTAGKVGVSGAVASTSTSSFTLGAVGTEVTAESITSGNPVANASGNYVMPRTVTIEFDGTMPDLIDDGYGNLVVKSNYRRVGSFNYASGTPSWEVFHPYYQGSTITIDYTYSPLPNCTAVPNFCTLDRIVVASKRVGGSAVNPSTVSLYEDSGKTFPVQKASFTQIATGTEATDFDTYEADLGDAPSVQRDFTTNNRIYRWAELGASVNADSIVLLYWKAG